MINIIEAEQAVLGSLIIESTWHWYIPRLQEGYFTTDAHRKLFLVIKNMFSDGRGIDHVTVSTQLMKDGIDISVASKCSESIAQTNNFETYVASIKEVYISKKIRQAGVDLAVRDQTVEEAVIKLDQTYKDVNDAIADGASMRDWASIIDEAMSQLGTREKQAKKNESVGVPSGLRELDLITNGWQNDDLIILAGRPSMGKTALALHFAQYAKCKTLFFSQEMSDVRLADRMLIAESGVDADKFRSGFIKSEDWEDLEGSISGLLDIPLVIDDKPRVSLGYIRAQVMRAKPKFVIIDYLQLMSRKGYDANQEYGEITKGLKAIAKQEGIPIVLLCQLNRDTEKNRDSVPKLSNLRDSGEIEQDADLVFFVYRPKYYKIDNFDYRGDNISTDGVLAILIEKHRNGRIGQVIVKHNKSITKFTDYEKSNWGTDPEEAPY